MPDTAVTHLGTRTSAGKAELMIMRLTDQERRQRVLVRELQGTLCVICDGRKRSKNTFCVDCYLTLPREMQRALYREIGKGYEEAYDAAVGFLRAKLAV